MNHCTEPLILKRKDKKFVGMHYEKFTIPKVRRPLDGNSSDENEMDDVDCLGSCLGMIIA